MTNIGEAISADSYRIKFIDRIGETKYSEEMSLEKVEKEYNNAVPKLKENEFIFKQKKVDLEWVDF